MTPEIEGNWDIVITSLQDICNSNESLTFDNIYNDLKKYSSQELSKLSTDDLSKLQEEIIDHKSNIGTAKRLINTSTENLTKLIEIITKENKLKQAQQQQQQASTSTSSSSSSKQLGQNQTTPSKTKRNQVNQLHKLLKN